MTPSATDQSASIDRFFNSKPQTPAAATRPDLKGDLSFTVDVLDVRDKVMRIRGWGLRLNPPHQAGDRITIVLVGAIGSYAAMADVEKRPDVSAVLKQPGWDDTGFVSLIDTTRMEPGNYTIFLRIAGADGEAIKSTNRNLTL